jgi:uncharacterized repeat protein (TIGR03837 family)
MHPTALHESRPDWDLFCRVIDNHGDLGVCWRLAADLASRGQTVRLWCDDASALRWMAPQGAPGVTVLPWRDPLPHEVPAGVVIEAFGCDPPPAFVERMAAAPLPPLWINLEYLSAEPYVERSHRLASPQGSGPGKGLTKWFFYPGFTPRTGGLLREPGLIERNSAHRAAAEAYRPEGIDRVMLLFCYPNPALPTLLDALATDGQARTLLRVTPGFATEQVRQWLAGRSSPLGALSLEWLDYVDHPGFDARLAGSDFNAVRGEDSVIRALWAGRPLLWQIYPQHDEAHRAKLEAFLDHHLSLSVGPDDVVADTTRQLHLAWNGFATLDVAGWQQGLATLFAPAAQHIARQRCNAQSLQPDLTRALLEFVVDKKAAAR